MVLKVRDCSTTFWSLPGLPPILPLALADASPSIVLSRISSRSNWLTPLKMVKSSLPCGVVVSSHGSFSDLMFAPDFSTRSTRSKRSLTERLSLVSSQMMTVSPSRSMSSKLRFSEQRGNSGIKVLSLSCQMVSMEWKHRT